MICKNCSNEFEGKFCPECGTKVEPEITLKECPECGAEQVGQGAFCANCGHNLNSKIKAKPTTVEQQEDMTTLPDNADTAEAAKTQQGKKIDFADVIAKVKMFFVKFKPTFANVYRYAIAGGMIFSGIIALLCMTAPAQIESMLGLTNNLGSGFKALSGDGSSAVIGASVMLLLTSLFCLGYGGFQIYLASKKPYFTVKNSFFWVIDGVVCFFFLLWGCIVASDCKTDALTSVKLGSGFGFCIAMGVFGFIFLALRIFYELKAFDIKDTKISEEEYAVISENKSVIKITKAFIEKQKLKRQEKLEQKASNQKNINESSTKIASEELNIKHEKLQNNLQNTDNEKKNQSNNIIFLNFNNQSTIQRTQIKEQAKQIVKSNFGKVLTPLWAILLWGLIILVGIAVSVVLFIFTPWYCGLIVAIPIVIIAILAIINLKMKCIQFYLDMWRGNNDVSLKSFFKFSGTFSMAWKLFIVGIMTTLFSFLFIFLPGYISTLFSIKNYEVVDNKKKKIKVHFEEIARMTQPHIFEISLVNISFFWWTLLVIATLGIAALFVSPYKALTKAGVYDSLLESYKDNEKIKHSLGQIASGQLLTLSSDGISNKGLGTTAFVDNKSQENFEKIKKDFCELENSIQEYILFRYSCDKLMQCEDNDEVLQIVEDCVNNMAYRVKVDFTKNDFNTLKRLSTSYTKFIGKLPNSDYYAQVYKQIKSIAKDRIKVLNLEMMKIKRSLMSAGGRIRKLKKFVKETADYSNSQYFQDQCAEQIKVEKKSRLMSRIIAGVISCCFAIAIIIPIMTLPFPIVIENGIHYYRSGDAYEIDDCNSSKKDITIKDSVRGLPVTSIGACAFQYCSSLTSITIPNSVTSIGSSAFRDCSSLTSIIIPNSVTSISYGAFRGCSSLTSITIPNSVTSIGESAFFDCSSLTSITIPNSVTSISYGAFFDCSSLTSIIIPNSVTSIGAYAFSGCSSLTSITIPNSVTSIGAYAFSSCSELETINFEGTKAEWYAINYYWDNYTIVCTDGTIRG